MNEQWRTGFAPIVVLVVVAAVVAMGAGLGLQYWFAEKTADLSPEGKRDRKISNERELVDTDIITKSPIRGIDFKTVVREKFLSNESRECLDSLDTAFFDLDGDGEEEAVVNARTCLGFSDGRNGPTISDVHRVFKLSDGGAVFDLPVDDGNFFKEVQEKISSHLEVREYDGKLEIEKGRINKTIAFQEKGATRFWSPKGGFGTIWYKWDGEKFTIDTVEAKSVTKGEISIEFSPLQTVLKFNTLVIHSANSGEENSFLWEAVTAVMESPLRSPLLVIPIIRPAHPKLRLRFFLKARGKRRMKNILGGKIYLTSVFPMPLSQFVKR